MAGHDFTAFLALNVLSLITSCMPHPFTPHSVFKKKKKKKTTLIEVDIVKVIMRVKGKIQGLKVHFSSSPVVRT